MPERHDISVTAESKARGLTVRCSCGQFRQFFSGGPAFGVPLTDLLDAAKAHAEEMYPVRWITGQEWHETLQRDPQPAVPVSKDEAAVIKGQINICTIPDCGCDGTPHA
jgi:hypothetical protein